MNNAKKYLHTSVSDAKISLERLIDADAPEAARLALSMLEQIRDQEGQTSRQKMAATVLRKAARAIAESDALDKHGARAGDDYAEMPTAELRDWIALTVDDSPVKAANNMLGTLVSLRGEYGTATRRKMLATGLGKAASAMVTA